MRKTREHGIEGALVEISDAKRAAVLRLQIGQRGNGGNLDLYELLDFLHHFLLYHLLNFLHHLDFNFFLHHLLDFDFLDDLDRNFDLLLYLDFLDHLNRDFDLLFDLDDFLHDLSFSRAAHSRQRDYRHQSGNQDDDFRLTSNC